MKGLILMALAWLPLWCAGPPMGGEKQAAGERGVPLETEPMEKADTLAASRGEERQEPFKKIRPRFEASGLCCDKIEFLDEDTGQVIATVDVKSMDPYKTIMNGTVAENKLIQPNYYKISDESRATLKTYLQKAGWADRLSADSVDRIRWEIVLYDGISVTDFIAVGYQLYLMNDSNREFAILAEYKVFNWKGEVIAELCSDLGGLPPIVTQDGKWMAVRHGDEFAEHVLPMGLLFFDLRKKELAYRDTLTNRAWWIGYFPILDYIVSVEDIGSPLNNLYSIYKLNEGKKYARLFDETAGSPGSGVFENYDGEGVYYPISRYHRESIVNGERIRKRATFEDDFKMTNLKMQKQ